MNLTFNKQNGEMVLKSMEDILQNFSTFIKEWEEFPSKITTYYSNFVTNKIRGILIKISIDEINNGKFKFDLQRFKTFGIKTFNDLAFKSEQELVAKYNIPIKDCKNIKICLDDVINTINKKMSINFDEINYQSDNVNIIFLLYKYMYGKEYIEYCNSFLNANIEEINNKLNTLDSMPSLFGKVFMSNDSKEELNNAYDYLYDLLHNSEFSKKFNSLTSIMTTSKNVAFNDFMGNKERYEITMKEIYPNAITKNVKASNDLFDIPFEKNDVYLIKSKLKTIISTLYCINDAELSKLSTVIKINANVLLKEQIINSLKDVTLDSLDSKKLNIRVKTLQDAGYNSVYDIYQKTPYELAKLGGISFEMSNRLLEVCKKVMDEMGENAKIKINSDNKTESSTSLLRSILAYINYNAIRISAGELIDGYEQKINVALNCLNVVDSKIKWLYTNDENKAKIVNAYKFLTNLLKGDFFDSYSAIANKLEANNNLDDNIVWKSFNKNPIIFFNILEVMCPDIVGSDDKKFGLPQELAEQIEKEEVSKDGLICALKRYQEWGVKYILHQKNVLLGDEMGLGKTIQAIATMVSMRNNGATHFLVICPASVLENWVREIAKHSDLNAIKIHGRGRLNAFNKWKDSGGVAVTTYETTSILKFEEGESFNLLVVDEAHYVKNPDALRTKRVTNMSLIADRLLFMTGTALENRLDEMINIISIVNQDLAEELANITTPSVFKEKVVPVYYRRRRKDVLTELPDLQEYEEWCDLTKDETELYEDALLSGNFMQARRLSWNVPIDESTKANRMLEIIDEAKESNRKVIVFSYFLDTLNNIAKKLGSKCVGIINGATSPKSRQEIIDKFDEAPDGSVIVSQILSGGVGLNIQAASVVILCEPQYKPSTEQQAISRAYRMGQPRNVLVYKLLATNTIDEKMTLMLHNKQEIFDNYADESVVAMETIKLDRNNLKEILQEEIDRIKYQRKIADDSNAFDLDTAIDDLEKECEVIGENNVSDVV